MVERRERNESNGTVKTLLFKRQYVFSHLSCTFLGICIALWLSNDVSKPPSLETRHLSDEPLSSSVWCHEDDHLTRCSFKNLCYVPEASSFVVFLSPDSTLVMKDRDVMKRITLSSVKNHTSFYMPLVTLPSHAAKSMNISFLPSPAFVMWRFKVDNIMHVIHDDLLPLFFTYSETCFRDVDECVTKHLLVFADGESEGPYFDLYRNFSYTEPLLLNKLVGGTTVCFSKALAGLSTHSVVYQYGFGVPQGPIGNHRLHWNDVEKFTSFVLRRLAVPEAKGNVILFQRKHNRRILNEDEVTSTLKALRPDRRIVTLDLLEKSVGEIISLVASSEMAVGMHGAILVLTLFLPPGAVLVELFPFGIQSHVSPYKTLAELPGRELRYKPWFNVREENSVGYPDDSPAIGGISHLPQKEQEEVLTTKLVPPVVCCHDAAYLYRMFQDTVVDVASFRSVLEEVVDVPAYSPVSYWMIPSAVRNLRCVLGKSVHVTWEVPLNAQYFLVKNISYEVTVQIPGVLEGVVLSSLNEVSLPLPEATSAEGQVWVAFTTDHFGRSKDTWVKCTYH